MCGIVGAALRPNSSVDLEHAVSKLKHRGPDDQGTWRDESVALGFARLAIIDLSELGRQPMLSPDGRFVIVFNGEIYNFQELRDELTGAGEVFAGHSDTEILLRLFVRKGLEGCLSRLRGMFAFAIWDRAEKELVIARDRIGVKPLVYAETSQGVLFGSEIQALFALDPTLPRQPDYQALDHFLSFQYIPAPMTGFIAIRKLPPAHAMIVRDGRVRRVFRYWDLDLTVRSKLSFGDACEALRHHVMEATRLRLVSDVPLGAFLSGGIDSSITVAAMAKLGASPLKTFSIGFEDERFNELPQAKEIAQHLGTDHNELMVKADAVGIMPQMIDHLGEPLADNSIMPTFYVSRFARTHVTVALTGDGGDELFAGYRRFYQIRRSDWLARHGLTPLWRGLRKATISVEAQIRSDRRGKRFPASRADEILCMRGMEAYKHLLAFFPDVEKQQLITPELSASIGASRTTEYLAQHFNRPGLDVLNRYLALDMTTYLPEDILFKVDIASMANSLECRSPFLDHKVAEFAASLPGSFKLSPTGRHKHILKEAFKGWLPDGFMDRPKKGFSVPLGRWLKEDLSGMLVDSLVDKRVLAPWFRQEKVTKYVDEHVSGRAAHSTRLWPMLVLALWVERFRVTI